MATMAEVAREAGVSVASVSRLLNKQDIVSPETATRIYAAIKKLSYEPNILARNFRTNQSRVILTLSPNVTNPYYAHILSGIGDVATELGYSALICNTTDEPSHQKEALDLLKKRRADGAILMASNPGCDWLLEYANNYPVVQCCEFDPALDIPHVSIDNYLAAKQVMEYLLALGHRRIAMISSENDYISTRLRMQGYLDTLEEHGIIPQAGFVTSASRDYSFNSGKIKARELLGVTPRPTAIFCISDIVALGAITAAKEMGYRVPEDVTVVGFDDVEHTMMFHPYITTVAQPCYEIGRQAARLLYTWLTQGREIPRETILEHRLIVRESSAPPTLLDNPR